MMGFLRWIALVLFFFSLLHFFNISYALLAVIAVGIFVLWVLVQWRLGKFDPKKSDIPPESEGE